MLFVPRRLPGAQACAEPHPFGMQDMKKGFLQVPNQGKFSGSGETCRRGAGRLQLTSPSALSRSNTSVSERK